MGKVAVSRLDFGYFVRPSEETGTGAPRVEACLGYLVDHPDGLILMDSGMGTDPESTPTIAPLDVPLRLLWPTPGSPPTMSRSWSTAISTSTTAAGTPD